MSATESSQGRSKALNIVVWIVSVLVCVSMLMPGVSQVVNLEGRSLDGWSQRFEEWGLPPALVPVVGAAELGGGVLLLVPKAAPFGGVAVGIAMIGAMFTHMFNDQLKRAPIPLVIALLAFSVSWYRWNRRARSS